CQPHPTGARVISKLAFTMDCLWHIELCDTRGVEVTTHAKRNPSTDVGFETHPLGISQDAQWRIQSRALQHS
ncbi:MAG: hypothetical protein ACKPKO_40900, partial [Candidatus Fonsibacter sp.]